uniref:Putative secreted protein 94 n=1 Tax=Amblyomma parvum TaxID=251391 RepID=A0A023G1J5_AMBPA
MFFLTLFIVCFGMCAGKKEALFKAEVLNNEQLFRRSLKMVRGGDNLHLFMFSVQMTKNISKCLVSQFLKRTKDGAIRTLETNNIVESKEMETNSNFPDIKTNVTINVRKDDSSPPYFDVTFQPALPFAAWMERQNVIHAKPEQCLLLGSPSNGKWSRLCTLWGPKKCQNNPKCWLNCQMTFVEKCRTGVPVNLTQCAETNLEKGGSYHGPK